MGIKRIVDVQFWNDDKVLEYFSPEDKLFMLYLMTNPHTTQLGIYAINKKHMSFELGYTIDVINVLLDRFENKYEMVRYSDETKEIAIKNYLKHSIIKGGAPVRDCLIKELRQVKDKKLIEYVFVNLKGNNLLNMTVQNLIEEYEKENGKLTYSNSNKNDNDIKNDNENDNDNEVSLYDTLYDTFKPSSSKSNDEEILKNEFNEIWKLYPKKVGKEKAFAKYKKYRTSKGAEYCTYDEVLTGLNRYLKYIEQNAWYSPKDGSTWFNNKSWNDEYELKEDTLPKWFNETNEKVEIDDDGKRELEELLKEFR